MWDQYHYAGLAGGALIRSLGEDGVESSHNEIPNAERNAYLNRKSATIPLSNLTVLLVSPTGFEPMLSP
jgi:hypothetical protein